MTGSPNTNVNGLAVSRVTDIAVHTCFSPDSFLFVNGEFKTFKEVNVDDEVITPNGEIGIITNITKQNYIGKLQKIKIRGSSYEFYTTLDHKILDCSGSPINLKNIPERCWSSAEELHVRSKLVIPKIKFGTGNNYNKTKLFGRWLGFGRIFNDFVEILFSFGESKKILKYKYLIEKVYKKTPHIKYYKENETVGLIIPDVEVCEEFKFLFGERGRKLPKNWISWDERCRQNLIDGLYDAVGIDLDDKKLLTIQSETLANQLAFLLFSLNETVEIIKNKKSTFNNSTKNKRIFRVEWFKPESSSYGKHFSNYFATPISHIKSVDYDGVVYDITIKDKNNSHAFATPFIVSNCPHCGINIAVTGSPNVIVNSLQTHRVGDVVNEICGTGQTITGSPNVFANGG